MVSGRKTKRVRHSPSQRGGGRKTKRVRHSPSQRGGDDISQKDMYSVLNELKNLQKSVRQNINSFVTQEIENINSFVTKEMLRLQRPIIRALAKFDISAEEIAPIYIQQMSGHASPVDGSE